MREEEALKAAQVSESRAQVLEAELSNLTPSQMPSPIANRSPEPCAPTPMLPSNATASDADIARRLEALRSGDPSYSQVSPSPTIISRSHPKVAEQSTPGRVPHAVREKPTDTCDKPLVKPLSVPCLSGMPGQAPRQPQESFCRGCGSKLFGVFCSSCGLRSVSGTAPVPVLPMTPEAPQVIPGQYPGDRGNNDPFQSILDKSKAIAPPPPPPVQDTGQNKTIFISPASAPHTPPHVLP